MGNPAKDIDHGEIEVELLKDIELSRGKLAHFILIDLVESRNFC